MIVAPGANGNGKPCARTVEFVDLYPTLADFCKLPAPRNLAGKSLRPLLDNPNARWTKPAYTQVTWTENEREFMGRSVRTERWRYIEWDEGKKGVELYDVAPDGSLLYGLDPD